MESELAVKNWYFNKLSPGKLIQLRSLNEETIEYLNFYLLIIITTIKNKAGEASFV